MADKAWGQLHNSIFSPSCISPKSMLTTTNVQGHSGHGAPFCAKQCLSVTDCTGFELIGESCKYCKNNLETAIPINAFDSTLYYMLFHRLGNYSRRIDQIIELKMREGDFLMNFFSFGFLFKLELFR